MRILQDIIYKVSLVSIHGETSIEVHAIQYDSRKVQPNDLFVAIKGTQSDGHQYIHTAIEAGAKAIICEHLPKSLVEGITYIETKNSAQALGIVAANFYDNPSEKIKVVGVTGTNGKTTITTILYQLFKQLGYKVGLISTVKNLIDDQPIVATHTTPDACQIQSLLSQMYEEGCTHCFMEVSSHAISQHRISGIQYKGAIFSNISHDHLDYHGSFENYLNAKKQLFDGLPSSAFALSNRDDKRGTYVLQNTAAQKYYFSLQTITDYRAKLLSNTIQGLELDIQNHSVWFKLIGKFNGYNLLACFACAHLLGEQEEDILRELSMVTGAAGRMQLIVAENNPTGIVDYAHTPDALKNVLQTITKLHEGIGEIITIVGCGGDRDRQKRPKMLEIAAQMSDKVIVTTDNPRSEKPSDIIKDMMEGIGPSLKRKVLKIEDRQEAIKTACMLAKKMDIILLAGKGHEKYQEIKGVKHPFDDVQVLEDSLRTTNLNNDA